MTIRFEKLVPDWTRSEQYKLGHYQGSGWSCWYLVPRGGILAMQAKYVADELRTSWVKVTELPKGIDWSPRITKARVTIVIELGVAYAYATGVTGVRGSLLDDRL